VRNMSFSLTTKQFIDGSKTVTRRLGWWNLKPGDVVMAVEKGMGLKRGERVQRLGLIKITDVSVERLYEIDQDDVVAEGFPQHTPIDFIRLFIKANKCDSIIKVNRIKFEKLNLMELPTLL
jgi:hypothetical protein